MDASDGVFFPLPAVLRQETQAVFFVIYRRISPQIILSNLVRRVPGFTANSLKGSPDKADEISMIYAANTH